MNYHEACELLDRVRHGYLAHPSLINEALRMTGDLDEDDRDSDIISRNTYVPMPSKGGSKDAKRKPDQGV